MILNIGEEEYIGKESIIMILNKESVVNNRNNRNFIDEFRKNHGFIGEDHDKIKSYIICRKGKGMELYPSIISSKTLAKRNNLEGWR